MQNEIAHDSKEDYGQGLRSKETSREEKGRRRTWGREEEILRHLLSGSREKGKIRDDPMLNRMAHL